MKNFNAQQLTQIAVSDSKAAYIIVTNPDMYIILGPQPLTEIAISHSKAAYMIVTKPDMYKRLDAQQLVKIGKQ